MGKCFIIDFHFIIVIIIIIITIAKAAGNIIISFSFNFGFAKNCFTLFNIYLIINIITIKMSFFF